MATKAVWRPSLPRRYALLSRSLLLFGALLLLATAAFAKGPAHQPITAKLMALVSEQPEVGQLLEASLAEAKRVNPDPATNPAQSLEDYYGFIDQAAQLIPRQVLQDPESLTRDQILQSICYFYFLIDQPLPALGDQGFYRSTLQFHPAFSSWLRDFANAWGAFLDTEASWTDETYRQFRADPRFGLQRDWYEPGTNWHSFNRFFARFLRSPDVRPIASPEDAGVVVSPADSVPQGVWAIDADSRIAVEGGLEVKLARFFDVGDLLGPDSAYRDAFAGGVLTHTFLNVNDYHRYHFAVGGTVKERALIGGHVALEATWDADQGKYVPIDSTGWQFTQTRGVVIVETGDKGLVALIPMGMAQVSSVNFENDVQPGIEHRKGDMLGNFLFGGSDFVMLFQEQAGFELTAPTSEEEGGYAHILMGTEYGRMRGAAP